MNPIDGINQFYVGQSDDYVKRNKQHLNNLNKQKGNHLFQHSFNLSDIKTLEEFTARRCLLLTISKKEETSDAAHALEVTAVEQHYIDLCGTNNVCKIAGAIDRSLTANGGGMLNTTKSYTITINIIITIS